MAFFSVIIPTYNRLHTLPETIASVIAQSFPDFEIIVADDGSSDETAVWISKQTDTRIRYFYKENSGVCATRNAGANYSKGEYLIFLDSDDLVTTEWLQDFFSEIKQTDADVVQCRRSINGDFKTSGYQGFLAGTFCIKRALFFLAGGYDEYLRFGENTELKWRVEPLVERLVMLERPNVIYRVSGVGGANRDNRISFLYHVVKKHPVLFEKERKTAQLLFQVAGVDCFHLERFNECRTLLWKGFVKRPWNIKAFYRFAWYSFRSIFH